MSSLSQLPTSINRIQIMLMMIILFMLMILSVSMRVEMVIMMIVSQKFSSLFWSLKIILSTAKIFLKLYLLVVLCRKKLKSTFSDLLLKTANKSGCFSAKAFLVRGTATERNACSYTVWRDVSLKFISANKGLPRAILLHDTACIVHWEFEG